jgi:hypothetical protein
VYIDGAPSGIANCAPVVHLAHSIAQYDNDYDMRSVLLGNKNIMDGDIIFYQICALSQGQATLEAKLDPSGNSLTTPITLIVSLKPKKLSFGPDISFAHIWNMHPHHYPDPIYDQPGFEYQVCKAQLEHGCMIRFCTALKRAGVSLQGLRGNKCGQSGHEHEHHFTNPYDFIDWRGTKDAFVWEAKSRYQGPPQPGIAAYKFVAGKQGVVVFWHFYPLKTFSKAHPDRDLLGGHIDLWNKDHMGNDIGYKKFGLNLDSCFLRSSKIFFWPM